MPQRKRMRWKQPAPSGAPSGYVAQLAVGASQQCVGQPVASKLHDKPKDSHDPGDLQAIGFHTNNLVQEVVKWQTDCATRCIPDRRSDDTEEAKLGERFKKLLLQRDKALGPEPSRRKLSLAEVALVNSVPGVPFRGCSVHGTTKCGIAQGGSGIATSGGPHLAACSQKEEDAQPRKRLCLETQAPSNKIGFHGARPRMDQAHQMLGSCQRRRHCAGGSWARRW